MSIQVLFDEYIHIFKLKIFEKYLYTSESRLLLDRLMLKGQGLFFLYKKALKNNVTSPNDSGAQEYYLSKTSIFLN